MWSYQTIDLVTLWGELFPLVCAATMRPTNPQVTHNWIGSFMNWVMLWCCMACASSCVHQTANLEHERHVVKGLETPLNRKISKEWLSQWVSFGEGLTSGGTPPGEPSFAFLAREGYRTIVSVDGARPDLESAHRHSRSYVHLPMSYDGRTHRWRWVCFVSCSNRIPGFHSLPPRPSSRTHSCSDRFHGQGTLQPRGGIDTHGARGDFAGLFRFVAIGQVLSATGKGNPNADP